MVAKASRSFLPATSLVIALQNDAGCPGTSVISSRRGSTLAFRLRSGGFVISQQLFRWDPGEKAPRRARLWAASTIIPFLLLGAWEIHTRFFACQRTVELSAPWSGRPLGFPLNPSEARVASPTTTRTAARNAASRYQSILAVAEWKPHWLAGVPAGNGSECLFNPYAIIRKSYELALSLAE